MSPAKLLMMYVMVNSTKYLTLHLASTCPGDVFRSVLSPTSVSSTVFASISTRARTDRDCSRMKVHMAKSGGTFCRHSEAKQM